MTAGTVLMLAVVWALSLIVVNIATMLRERNRHTRVFGQHR